MEQRGAVAFLDFQEYGSRLKLILSSDYYKIFKKEILCDLCAWQASGAREGNQTHSQKAVLFITITVTFIVVVSDNSA